MKTFFWSPVTRRTSVLKTMLVTMKLVTTKNVADENDEESDSESEAKVATPDQILEEPNTDEADLLHLLYASASSHDMSKADLRLHTLKGWDAHTEDSSKYCLHDAG
ncbi:hypothetical protein Pcac1_g17733 [Phytophthora cactorum]|uniref:Uncharacterized protein n=2 Tax=Phytophthora cactorum TaxID=29920 RepID=A0A8T1CYK7_9STRA|nr:hypothetical protein Pcac1_g17733 [Phytophthora cactorum]KAG2860619.1 hypothetical protein PC113_g7919 [Phytophthora cactorum]KAG2930213.1 hypothetical protein PC115_g6627 [Phytophthora cactorum]KAG2946232.1 hypothetical protein PC117_g7802 [Phytophthora cactorum]KAG3024173.1 hypothetical protein PC119_g8637 [Phytophthora cactorum]